MNLEVKVKKLKEILASLGSAAIAYSGGVDSTYLLKAARDCLDKNVIALTASSPVTPEREIKHSRDVSGILKVKHIIIKNNCLDLEDFTSNPADRCYICKRNMFIQFLSLKEDYNFKYLIDGTNSDDLNLHRPGLKAIRELGVRSPLAEAGLTRTDIIELSRTEGLPGWNRPPFTCLATRIPDGEEITGAKLRIVDSAEEILRDLGFEEVRVRYHFPAARIEIPPDHFEKMLEPSIREKIIPEFKKLGFTHILLDLSGYKIQERGSNEAKD
ncbi:MAG: ATP-dependent sacrificial sulfur transferase LarE [Actinobacteria bacterium]|nr:ATP-dependent sacrificial sulfur transferase LarE [Actinomycetota bacterium]